MEGKRIIQVDFVGVTDLVAVLTSNGEIYLINAGNGLFVTQIKEKGKIVSFKISPDANCISTVLAESKFGVDFFRLDDIISPAVNDQLDVDVTEKPEPKPSVSFSEKPVQRVSKLPKTLYELIESKEESSYFNRRNLSKFLNHYGAYPDKYRQLIWRYILKLPENRSGYEALLDQGIHPSYKNFRNKYPLKSDRLTKSMERVLSCLAYWSPIFEDLEYLPSLVFPFVKEFLNDLFSLVEILITVLINWCQKWWEYYPNPPIEALDILSQLLNFHDSKLLNHFNACKVSAQVYGWTVMQSLFSELFSKDDWLMVWDHLLSNQPSFMYHFMVAYLIHFRKQLIGITQLKDFYYFFQRRNPTNVSSIIKLAYEIKSRTPNSLDPGSHLKPFIPCNVGEYPIFNQYPQFIVNYQSRMKAKIREEEDEYIKKRQLAAELGRLTEALRKEKQQWETSDWQMNDMIEKWWAKVMEDEEERSKFRSKLNTIDAESKLDVMAQINAARKSFMLHQSTTTQDRLDHLAKVVGKRERNRSESEASQHTATQLDKLETEWEQRRQEMQKTREGLKKVQQDRHSSITQSVDPFNSQGPSEI